ncbi:hypothetical protein [Micromonospora sp. NBC_01638]|uniref:hypothetical protein n=1 Tax=Micromonospora sp. NBC_01638 TaxID=2975982 RepID=UPI00386BF992|nr:hypothetical protein OG811_00220 [Micromonospora sp. NBC_01638]
MGNSSNRRARTRAIRARMETTGEPYSVASRHVAAEQTAPAAEVSSAAASPSGTTMNDTAGMRDVLLDWVYDQAGSDTMNIVEIMPFAEEYQLDLNAAFTLVHICRDAGMARDDSTFGNPGMRLTPAGLTHVQERRRRRDDPALRAVAARSGLLRWMYRQHIAGVHMPLPDQFASAPEANFEGSPFTEVEIGLAAEYLVKRALIKGPGAFGHTGPVRADITPDGMDCVVDWSANVSAYLRRQEAASSALTYNGPVFHGDVEGVQLAWNNQSVTQNHNPGQQVAPGYEELAWAMADVLRLVPAMDLSFEAQEDVDAASKEILAEIVRDEPRPGPIRRALTVLRTWFTPIAEAGMAGAGVGVSEGAKEAARNAVALMMPF